LFKPKAYPLVPGIEAYEIVEVTYSLSSDVPPRASARVTIRSPEATRVLLFKDVDGFNLGQCTPERITGLFLHDLRDRQMDRITVDLGSSACRISARAVEEVPVEGQEIADEAGKSPLDCKDLRYSRKLWFSPERLGEWQGLSEVQRWDWLRFAKDRFFSDKRPRMEATERASLVLDGRPIHDLSSFFCAFGEAVNGPGGYFGRSLMGFDDCLYGGFGLEKPCEIVWKDSAVAAATLDGDTLATWCNERLDALEHEEDLKDFREAYVGLLRTMTEATDGKRTMFDEIVGILRSHSGGGGFSLKLE
jgi:hypothetical protein